MLLFLLAPITYAQEDKGLEAFAIVEGYFTDEEKTSCVMFARAVSRYGNFPKVAAAKDILAIRLEPHIGAVVIFRAEGRYGKRWGHAAVVTDIISSTTIAVIESNLIAGKITKRVIDITKEPIKGYWYTSFFH